jgi:hypothetical protein
MVARARWGLGIGRPVGHPERSEGSSIGTSTNHCWVRSFHAGFNESIMATLLHSARFGIRL